MVEPTVTPSPGRDYPTGTAQLPPTCSAGQSGGGPSAASVADPALTEVWGLKWIPLIGKRRSVNFDRSGRLFADNFESEEAPHDS